MSDQIPSTDLVIAAPQRLQRSFNLLPESFGEAKEMALLIANSDFAPKDYRGKPENVLIAVQMGADVGLRPLQALQSIAVINGRPSIWGDAALALVMPALERFKESFEGERGTDNYAAVCVAKRKGWPDETIRRFSVADAKAAKLWMKTGRDGGPTPWVTYPDRMLQMRARSWTLRDCGADLLLGLILAEEAQDIPDDPRHVGSGHASESTGDAPEVAALLKLPEGMQERIEKGFAVCKLTNGLKTAKLKEFLLKPETDLEEQGLALLKWLEDEYAKRQTGKPVQRKKGDGNGKPAVSDQPTGAGGSDGDAQLGRRDVGGQHPVDPHPEGSEAPRTEDSGRPTCSAVAAVAKPQADLF